jgi:hypothetical protein
MRDLRLRGGRRDEREKDKNEPDQVHGHAPLI